MNNHQSFLQPSFHEKKKLYYVFGCFLILNILQAVLTPLLNDEPYYWVYSQNIDWGYLDHPPLIALLIKLSGAILPGEIGVRFICAVMGSFTFYYLYRIIQKECSNEININLIILLFGGSIFLHLYSFLAIPDTPLLFFGILFLWFYRNYLEKDNWQNIIALGIVIPLMLYSKYHGIILIVFTIMANFQIVKRKSFYQIFLIAMALLIPHIYWLAENDFRTIRFQFLERSSTGFDIKNILSYIGEQSALTGPVILLFFTILYKPENTFQKVLKFNVIGIFTFFLLTSFRGRLNTHWTAVAWLPMLILAYLYLIRRVPVNKFISTLLLLNFIIVFLFRLNLIINLFNIPHYNDKNPELMTGVIKRATNDSPLVFQNMYLEPSFYMFYQKQNCFAINNEEYKRTQFNYWSRYEKDIQRKTIYLISNSKLNDSSEQVTIKKGKTYFISMIPDFRSFFTTINVEIVNPSTEIKAGEYCKIKYIIKYDLYSDEQDFIDTEDLRLVLRIINIKTGEQFTYMCSTGLINSEKTELNISAPGKKGKYKCIFSIYNEKYPELMGYNSKSYFIRFK